MESVLSGKSKITFSENKGQTEDIKEDQHKLNQKNSTWNPCTQTKYWVSNHVLLNKKFTGNKFLGFKALNKEEVWFRYNMDNQRFSYYSEDGREDK